MDIGLTIKTLREENGLSQKELAEKLNLSNKTISSWEKNRTQPHMEFIEEMCKIFKCSKSYFLESEFLPNPTDICAGLTTLYTDDLGNPVIVNIDTGKSTEITMKKAEIIKDLLKYAFQCTDMQIKSASDILKSYSELNRKGGIS